MSKRKLLWPVLVTVALFTTVLAVASIRKRLDSRTVKPPLVRPRQNPIVPPTATGQVYVRVAQLWPQLRWNLKAFGDRLQKPGKERTSLTGTLSRAGDAAPVPVILILEFPDRLRLTMQIGAQSRVITFNGQQAQGVGGPPDSREEDLIETIVYDTAEHFFAGQSKGTALRFLGEHFRLEDGTQANSNGPVFDVYQTTEQIKQTTSARQQTKLYCFDSDTHLLGLVTYELERNGSRTAVRRLRLWQSWFRNRFVMRGRQQ